MELDESTILLLLGAALVAIIVCVAVCFANPKCRVYALVALVIVLGVLTYIGHRESIHHFANKTGEILKPMADEIADSDTVKDVKKTIKKMVTDDKDK